MEQKEGLVKLVLEDETSFCIQGNIHLLLDKKKKSLSMSHPDYFDFPGSRYSFDIKNQPNPQLCLNYTTPKGTPIHLLVGEIPPYLLKEVNAFIRKANLYQEQ